MADRQSNCSEPAEVSERAVCEGADRATTYDFSPAARSVHMKASGGQVRTAAYAQPLQEYKEYQKCLNQSFHVLHANGTDQGHPSYACIMGF